MPTPNQEYLALVEKVREAFTRSHITASDFNGAVGLERELMERFGALVAPLDDGTVTIAAEGTAELRAVYHQLLTLTTDMRNAQKRTTQQFAKDARASTRFLDAWEKLAWFVLDSGRR